MAQWERDPSRASREMLEDKGPRGVSFPRRDGDFQESFITGRDALGLIPPPSSGSSPPQNKSSETAVK